MESDCKDKSSHFVYCGEGNVSMSAGSLAVLSYYASSLPPLTTCLLAKAPPSLLAIWTKAEEEHALGNYTAFGEKKCISECKLCMPLHGSSSPLQVLGGHKAAAAIPCHCCGTWPCNSGHEKGVSLSLSWPRFPAPAGSVPRWQVEWHLQMNTSTSPLRSN